MWETTIPFELATAKDPIRLHPEIEDFTASTSSVSSISLTFRQEDCKEQQLNHQLLK